MYNARGGDCVTQCVPPGYNATKRRHTAVTVVTIVLRYCVLCEILTEAEDMVYKFETVCVRSRVRFPALPDFLSSSWSGTGSTQPREVN